MYGSLKRVVCYFKRNVWYFEESGMLVLRGMYGTLKRVVCYFEEECMVL